MKLGDRREPPASPEPKAAKVEATKARAAKKQAAKIQAAKVQAALGLGGNVGDVRAAFTRALAALTDAPGVEVLRKSSLYRTAPWGPVAQPPFLNMAVLVRTTLSPHRLLDLCLSIERQEGRVRAERFGPRTLDVDILAFGELVLSDERLTLPHPRLLERAFALVPLAEVAPELVIGGVGIGEAAERLDRTGIERFEG
jgi:2-amino-4-hydroxy-6-hydroxymethyldihydropteridine diphosphokinase